MTHLAEHTLPGLPLRRRPNRIRTAPRDRRRVHSRDERWPVIAAELSRLRAAKRCSVRIIDADCGTGTLLLCAVRYARALGFTAIEARGIDTAPALIARACVAASKVHDPAIGLTFETADIACALDEEIEFPADIVLWHGSGREEASAARAVARAGRALIADKGVAA